MKTLLLILLLLTSTFFATANMDCIWTTQKDGITISYVAACNFANHSMVDSILKIITTKLNRQDTSLKIYVLLNHRWLSFPGGNFANFFSIGFDTLRQIDNDYIFDYYWNQETISTSKNGGANTFRSQYAPIDINSTKNKKATKTVGIKIMYDIDYRLGSLIWNDLVKAIIYAAKNPDIIKNEQRRDTVRFNTNGWYVSLLTIDTFFINKIIDKQIYSAKKEPSKTAATSKHIYWSWVLVSLFIIGFTIYKVRQYSR